MTVEAEIRQAIVDELQRQAENSGGRLKVEAGNEQVVVNGPLDVDDLVMVVMGSIAGGP